MTYNAFYNAMVSLPENHENRDLEEYLLALFSLVKKHEKEPFSPELCIEIIQKAFTETPMSFDEKWLSVCDAPDEEKGMAFTQNVLIFQIAELHRMRDKELQNPQRYSGINSETDNWWYNFDPFTNLECGAEWFLDSADSEEDDISADWGFLGKLLEIGRVYE